MDWVEASALVADAQRVLIVTHIGPDGDAIGSLCGLASALRRLGKQVITAVDEGVPSDLQFIPGAGEVVVRHGVKIVGHRNVPSRLAADTSALFSRNIYNFLSAFWDAEKKAPVFPDDDEIVVGVRLTKGGQVVSERLKG